jgi:hypothetical protein
MQSAKTSKGSSARKARAIVPAAVLVTLAGACGPQVTAVHPAAPASALWLSSAEVDAPETTELRAVVRGPAKVSYGSTVLGLNRREVTITLTNASRRPIAIGGRRLSFSAEHDGVAFACDPEPRAEPGAREPSELGPGESFRFARELGCWTPVPGRYDIGAYLSDAHGASAERGARIGGFTMEIGGGGANGPTPHPARRGLYVAMAGDTRMRPLSPEAWKRGEYQVVIALVNASRGPIPAGDVTVSFRVYKKDSPLPCAGESIVRHAPEALGAGEVHLVRAPVTCLRDEQGDYEVVGILAFDDGRKPDEFEMGRVRVRITSDPTQLWPLTSL